MNEAEVDAAFLNALGNELKGMTATTNGDGKVTFELEAPPPPGELPDRVRDELIHVRTIAKDYAGAYTDAVKTQAEKYKINVAALKRFIAAKCDDKLAEAQEEADALAKLLDA